MIQNSGHDWTARRSAGLVLAWWRWQWSPDWRLAFLTMMRQAPMVMP